MRISYAVATYLTRCVCSLLPSEEYLANQDVSGTRKRAVAFDDLDEDEEGSTDLGSDHTGTRDDGDDDTGDDDDGDDDEDKTAIMSTTTPKARAWAAKEQPPLR